MSNWYIFTDGLQKGPLSTDDAKNFIRENQGSYCWQPGFADWRPAYEIMEIWRFKKDGVTPFPQPPDNMMSTKPGSLPAQANQPTQKNSPAQYDQSVQHVQSTQYNQSGQQHQPVQSPHHGQMQPSQHRIVTVQQEYQSEQTPQVHQSGTESQTGTSSSGFGSNSFTDGIDFKVYGHEMQYIEVELDQGESAVAEAGALMYKSESIEMKTVFGDGTGQEQGFMSRLLGAGQRLLTGESLFITVFTQSKQGKGRVAFAAPFPGTIIPLKLGDYNNRIICQKDSFLAGSKGVQVGIHFQKKILTGLFGGEGFIMQKIEGDGYVFMHVGGAVHRINLNHGEVLHVDTGCLAAMSSTVDFDILQAGGIKTMLFGGEGLFFAKLTGPGIVWLQSLPFSRLAGRMLACAPSGTSAGSQHQGEGSILGGLGTLLGGR
ncbi:MAG: TIGR00266 family protein [Desulfamplus sp.]|nr:TIGR00266 family protein [Desulfamplus sp.]